MITRPHFDRQWGVHADGITAAPEVYPEQQPLLRTGRVPLALAPHHTAMDLTRPQTWRRPVRFT